MSSIEGVLSCLPVTSSPSHVNTMALDMQPNLQLPLDQQQLYRKIIIFCRGQLHRLLFFLLVQYMPLQGTIYKFPPNSNIPLHQKPIEDDLMGDQVLCILCGRYLIIIISQSLVWGKTAWVFRRAIPVLLLNGRPPQFIRQAPVPMIKLWGPILCAEGEF